MVRPSAIAGDGFESKSPRWSSETGVHAPFSSSGGQPAGARNGRGRTYAALDLGTNNCRLLVARPTADGFRVIDAFSRIVRLGEGLSLTGRLSEAAIARTLEALRRFAATRWSARGVTRARTIATEACRSAANGPAFAATVRERLGIDLEIVDHETEAHLAAAGVGALADKDAQSTVMFDIGGGSSEIIWLGFDGPAPRRAGRVKAWESLRLGVVSLAEKFGGVDVSDEAFAAMKDHVAEALAPFVARVANEARCSRFHLLGALGDGDHHRRRAPQPAALRPPRGRRPVARPGGGRRGDRPPARHELRRARRQRLHRPRARRSGARRLRHPRGDPVAFPGRAAQDRRPGSARGHLEPYDARRWGRSAPAP